MRHQRPPDTVPDTDTTSELSPGRSLLRASVGLLALEAAFASLMLLASHPPTPRRPVVRIALTKPGVPTTKPSLPEPSPRMLVRRAPPAPSIPTRHLPPVVVVSLINANEPRRLPPRSLLLDGQENGRNGDPRRILADRLVLTPWSGQAVAERPSPSLRADATDASADLVLAEISIPPLPRREGLIGAALQWRDGGVAETARADRLLADALGYDMAEGYGFRADPDQELPSLWALPAGSEPESAPESQVASGPTVTELSELFAELDTPMFKGGQVPSVFLDRLPGDLADEPATRRRKELFLRTMLPLIVKANDRSLALRDEIQRIDQALSDGGEPTPETVDSMARLLAEFRLDSWDRAELLRRADTVPPSLALAQAATESGWGRSSFARDGNALFGQREFTRTDQSDGKKVPRLRRFDDLAGAVAAYVRNLNTHPAYAEFRRVRASLRSAGQMVAGSKLVSYLVRYSEQGQEYTRYIQGIMRSNDLAAFDRTKLRSAASAIVSDSQSGLTKPRLE